MASPCGPRWHRHFLANGEVIWFRVLGRWRDANRTIGYNMGSRPDDRYCHKVWCHDGKPIACQACGELIDVKETPAAG